MRKSSALWFVGGFMFGVAVLMTAIAIAPLVGLAPKAAKADTTATAGDNSRISLELMRKMQSVDKKLSWLQDWFAAERDVEATPEAHESLLGGNLQTLRSQLELYRVQHLEQYPGQTADDKVDPGLFTRCLLERTNQDGTPAEDGRFGPYLRKMPENPFVEGSAASAVKIGEGSCPGDGTTGWYFDTRIGTFFANDPEHNDW